MNTTMIKGQHREVNIQSVGLLTNPVPVNTLAGNYGMGYLLLMAVA
jgi:hypothetical protein